VPPVELPVPPVIFWVPDGSADLPRHQRQDGATRQTGAKL